jgi:anoctamin-10/anoctamin-7
MASVEGLEDVLVYIGIIALFFLFLKKLLQYAKEAIEKEEFFTNEDDDFYKKYGYTYEYVFVFPVHAEGTSLSDGQKKFSVNNVYQRLKNAQLDVRCFYSCQRDEVYVKVRASPDRLKQEASRINYRLLLNAERLKSKLTVGKKRNGEWLWRPIIITDYFQISSFNPYEYIYASYDDNAANEGLYQEYPAYNECKHIFKSVDR